MSEQNNNRTSAEKRSRENVRFNTALVLATGIVLLHSPPLPKAMALAVRIIGGAMVFGGIYWLMRAIQER